MRVQLPGYGANRVQFTMQASQREIRRGFNFRKGVMFRQPSTTFTLCLVAIGRGIVSLMRLLLSALYPGLGSRAPDIMLNSVEEVLHQKE